ncbi:MAG: hypothetical protein ABSH05_04680 [Bryobacteraceae bacterium]|jgi:hypothetical protein
MASPVSEFGRTAQRLSRNPLGIIALFIVLVYGIAGLVLGYSSPNLQPSEKLPLIWFLVLFPIIVLGAFLWLVTRHHVKLYAPYDFPDKEGFFRAMTPAEQRQRLDAEVEAIQAEAVVAPDHRTLAVEMEGSGIAQAVSIRHAYVLAEELAFREIEREFGMPVQRNVAIGSDIGLDGILLHHGKPMAIEVKFTRQPSWRRLVEHTLPRLERVLERSGPMNVVLAIVVEGLTPEQRQAAAARITEMLREAFRPILLRVYDFDELRTKYGVAGRST